MISAKKQFGNAVSMLPLVLPSAPTSGLKIMPLPPQLPPKHRERDNPEEPWRAMTSGEPVRVNETDTVNIARFMKEFVSGSLIPWMEQRILEWNEQASALSPILWPHGSCAKHTISSTHQIDVFLLAFSQLPAASLAPLHLQQHLLLHRHRFNRTLEHQHHRLR